MQPMPGIMLCPALFAGVAVQARQQGTTLREATVHADASCAAARAGRDRGAQLETLTKLGGFNPDAVELAVQPNSHPPGGEPVDLRARNMAGRLDSCAAAVDNAGRSRQSTDERQAQSIRSS